MVLAELHKRLAPSFPPSMQKDLQTAVRYLAQALHCVDTKHCLQEHYHQPLPTLTRVVEDSLLAQGKGVHTIRNTKNCLRRMFRLADEQHLFVPIPLPLTSHFDPYNRPPRPGSTFAHTAGTYLCYRDWPLSLQEAFMTFSSWATAPLVPSRPAHFRKRPVTLGAYRRHFESYFGYLHFMHHLSPTFEHLFDFALVTAYVHWHVNERHHKPTHFIRAFLTNLLAMTHQYRPLPDLHAELLALRKTIPVPPPTFNKADAWVSLATLQEIARTLWPRQKPTDFRQRNYPGLRKNYPGLRTAVRAGMSLLLHLWTYRPYRQRNIREMQLDENLYKNHQGLWRIRFQAEQLKIAHKHGRPNIFDLPFPPALVPLLEDYLQTWRPILLTKAGHPDPHIFLNSNGIPFTVFTLRLNLNSLVYGYTGKHWHPHMIRTVWATEWIQKTHGDFSTAAILLNDKLETVIAKYTHLLDENVAEKADRLIDERIGQEK